MRSGAAESASDLGLDHNVGQRVLSDTMAEAIEAKWVGTSIQVLSEGGSGE